jgi:hypothetical protein
MDGSEELRGDCRVMFAYDISQAIDLAGAAAAVRDPSTEGKLGRTYPAPEHFQFTPPPLRVSQRVAPIEIGRWRTNETVEVVVFDFGAVLVSYSIPLQGSMEDCVELSCALASSPVFAEESRRRVEQLAQAIAAHVTKGSVAEVFEDYHVFRFHGGGLAQDIEGFLARSGADLARILRAERDPLSKGEVQDALATRSQYGSSDLALIDWHAAVLLDETPEDVLRVLEYANVQLLEMRFLDAQLDAALERSLRSHPPRAMRRFLGPMALRRELQELASMQIEAAFLFERLGNTLKISGDPYLARVLRQASGRFRLNEWNDAAQRKLAVLDNLYDKLHDHASTLRAESLEWLIVLLIVIEILLSLFVH